MIGTVIQVNADPVRSFLAGPAAASDTSLLVDDVAPFAMPGAQVSIEGETYDVVSTLPSTVADEPDVLVIEPGLMVDVEEGEPVDLHPEIFHTHAVVEFPDGHIESEVLIDQDYQAQKGLAPGSYEGDARPVVTMEFRDGQHVIVGVDGRGEIDGTNVIPDPDWPGGDVEPVAPGYSPAVTATGGPGSVALSWLPVPNETPVSYSVYDLTSGIELGVTSSTGWLISPVDGPHMYDVWAFSGPPDDRRWAPGPSDPVQGVPDKDAQAILVANEFYSANGVVVGASDGPGFDIRPEGWTQRDSDGNPRASFPSDPSLANFIRGRLEVLEAIAEKFVFTGTDNLVQRNGRLMLASSTEAPQPPSVSHYWPRSTTPHDSNDPEDPWGALMLHVVYGGQESGHAVMYGCRVRVVPPGDYVFDLVRFLVDADETEPVGTPTVVRAALPAFPQSMVLHGGLLWVQYGSHGQDIVYNPTTGAIDRSFTRSSAGLQQGHFVDGTSLRFWRQTTSTNISFWTINTATGAASVDFSLTIPSTWGTVRQILAGDFDFETGGRHYLFLTPDRVRAVVGTYGGTWNHYQWHNFQMSTTSGDYLAWLPVDGCFISTGFYATAGTPLLTRYTSLLVDDTDDNGQGLVDLTWGTTWARGVGRTYETELGSTAHQSFPARAAIRVNTGQWPPESDPPDPTDVDRAVIYLRWFTNYVRQVVLADRQTIWRTEELTPPFTGSGPPEVSTFPESASGFGALASASGGLALYGNGKAEVAREPETPVDVTNKAYVDVDVDTGWLTIPLRSGFVAQDVTLIPEARYFRGVVYIRGAVTRTSGNFTASTTWQVGDLPAAIPLSSSQYYVGSGHNGSAASQVRLNVGGATARVVQFATNATAATFMFLTHTYIEI